MTPKPPPTDPPQAAAVDSELDVVEAELVLDGDDSLASPDLAVPVGLDDAGAGVVLDVPARAGRARAAVPAVSGRSSLPTNLTALDVYLAKLKDVEILPVDEQAALAVAYQNDGDQDAAARLVASNLRLVVKIAFQFRRQWADVMDLIAEGNLGLAEAIRKFDAGRGVPFPSYARFWIKARILAFIQENKHLIHAGSRAARKLFWRLERERRALIQEGIEPTPKALADRMGVKPEDVEELAPILDQRALSLDTPMHGDDDGGRTRGETLASDLVPDPEQAAEEGQLVQQLREAFAAYRETLGDRDKVIWDRRLQATEPERLEDLGNEFGVSKERVRQLEVRIKAKLRDFLKSRLGEETVVQALQRD